ncbi:cyclin B1 interacting protein 1 [Blastomyces dermatitidis ATCC 18188]|uniref:Cyclin B1 interacting protein 1 n=1 Tax=Ajellomyces dermatitidis (strain ATCC 18188 / CBS 674.68) TaxID=653446 RepID=F2TCZ5_AJEDA|nr:cyclin B1 interacting protein 1 [Blastomyces dermatitidis ATCC 18188]
MAQALDFCLRCNSLKCRVTLSERAVVTTCSHIFCLQCADHLGLSRPTTSERQCPACNASLANPDDVVSTVLTPSEDYKTSVLSGLDPHTIMECAGRALAFWTYQSAQEIFYQEYLGKSLTEKYGALNQQMDKVIHDANSEISNLQNRISEMQMNQEQLQKKNHELVEIYREKCKKHAQISNLYNLLKSRAMRSQIQTAASDSVTQVLESLGGAPKSHSSTEDLFRPVTSLAPSPRRSPVRYPATNIGIEQLHRHQRSGSGSGSKNRVDSAMPPPSGLPPSFRTATLPPVTPQHRTRLPGPLPSTQRSEFPERQQNGYTTHNQIFPVPQRFAPEGVDSRFSHSSSSNYGLSAGIKIGRPSDHAASSSNPPSNLFGMGSQMGNGNPR